MWIVLGTLVSLLPVIAVFVVQLLGTFGFLIEDKQAQSQTCACFLQARAVNLLQARQIQTQLLPTTASAVPQPSDTPLFYLPIPLSLHMTTIHMSWRAAYKFETATASDAYCPKHISL
jgi:hypothetical protein